MIDVLIKLANDEIKDKMILDVYDHTGDIYTYTFDEKFKAFYDECEDELGGDFEISNKFLNYEVELITPKEKKYLIMLNARNLKPNNSFVNYFIDGFNQYVILGTKADFRSEKLGFYQTKFTEKELQSIQPAREFLEDMAGKYELIGVDDNEESLEQIKELVKELEKEI